MWETRRSRASAERTSTMRSGDWLKAVGGELDQVVDGLDLLLGDGLVGEGVGRVGLAEEQVLGGGVERESHGGTS
ncbi:hypothetical protein GCM10020000_29050 [Streptomyces olivoverticillatus]